MNRSMKLGAMLALTATLCGSAAAAPLSYEALQPLTGWSIFPNTRTPAAAVDSAGVVHLRGGLHGKAGISLSPFSMPLAYRPNKIIYVPVDLSNGRPGRLDIRPDGFVVVHAPPGEDARYFVSLEGVSYPRSGAPLQYNALALINGWHAYDNTTRTPSGAIDANNIVHLKGAIHQSLGANSPRPFVLPPALRPDKIIFVPIDCINGKPGRLMIKPDGTVTERAAGDFINAQLFTSLEGVSYPKSAAPLQFKAFALINGWKTYNGATRAPSGALDSEGIVHLQGTMYEPTGNSALPFALPPALRPNGNIYVRVTMLNGATGRLDIHPDGSVGLQSDGPFSVARSLTSLEGVTYAKN